MMRVFVVHLEQARCIAARSIFIFMRHPRLQNYLRSHRKRCGLTQAEAAFLAGLSNGAKISRYEDASCLPSLIAALAFEAIYRVPVRRLFAGLFDRIEKQVAGRSREQARRWYAKMPDGDGEQRDGVGSVH